jgi:hypothetical protein
MGAQVVDAGELLGLSVNALKLPPEQHAELLNDSAVLIGRQSDSKCPIGSTLPDLRREARLLGVPDVSLKASGIQ